MENKSEIKILLPVQIIGVQRRKDRSVKLLFETAREIDSAEYAVMDAIVMNDPEGWLHFRPNQTQVEQMPIEDVEMQGKTQSERIRNSLYVLWSKTGKPLEDFNLYYKQQTEAFINIIKGKIPLDF